MQVLTSSKSVKISATQAILSKMKYNLSTSVAISARKLHIIDPKLIESIGLVTRFAFFSILFLLKFLNPTSYRFAPFIAII